MTVPVGTILPYAGASAPSDYLLCYGQAVSRVTFASLFAAIGTAYGSGDGSTTFNVPDLRGRVPAGQDDMGGTSANRLTGQSGGVDGDVLGNAGGAETHTLTVAELAAHTHMGTTQSDGAHSHEIYTASGSGAFTGVQTGNSTQVATISTLTDGTHSHDLDIGSAGGDDPHNNVQPTIIVNYIIYAGAEADQYVAENGTDFYVTEDGADNYVTE